MLRRGLFAVSLIAVAASVASASPDAWNGQLLYLRPLGGNNPPFGRLFVASSDGSARATSRPPRSVMRSNGTGVRQITATNGVTEWGADWQRASSR